MRQALSMKEHIKASVIAKKFLSEFCLEVLAVEFDIKLLSFCTF